MISKVWLIRHAKSGYPPGIGDFDRPLNDRGQRDVLAMRAWIADRESATRVFASSAARTMATAEALFPAAPIESVDDLYLASARTIIATIEAATLEFEEIAVIGHNPGIGLAIDELSGGAIDTSFPTLSVGHFDVTTEPPWSYRLNAFVTPKTIGAG